MRKSHNLFSKHLLVQVVRLAMITAAGSRAGPRSPEGVYICNNQPPDKTLLTDESFKTNFLTPIMNHLNQS